MNNTDSIILMFFILLFIPYVLGVFFAPAQSNWLVIWLTGILVEACLCVIFAILYTIFLLLTLT